MVSESTHLMPLIIRADADSRIGTGHVMRCIALGQAWLDADRHQAKVRGQGSGVGSQGSGVGNQGSGVKEQERGNPDKDYDRLLSVLESPTSVLCPLSPVVFICAEISEGLADRLKTEGFDLVRIHAEPGSAEDIRQTLDVLSNLRSHPSSLPPWLVLDGYHFGVEYQRAIRAADYKLLLIDDGNHLPTYECDILLNQNINAAELNYSINPEARLLIGTDYILLRREFFQGLEPAEPERIERISNNVLVTLGGADPDNVTQKVIEALQQLDLPGLHAKIVVGPANPHQTSLEAVIQHSTSNIQLIHSAHMPELMNWADFAISAAGSTCWELLSMGVPFATVILADNQEGVARFLEEQGGIHCFGWAEEGFEGDVAGFLKKIHAEPPQELQSSPIIDGLGAGRVVEQLRKCSRDP